MRISAMTRVFWGCYSWPGRTFGFTLPQILRRISQSSYDSVDLCEYPLEFWPQSLTQEHAENLKRMVESLSLKVSGITVPTFAPGLEILPLKKDRMIIVDRLQRAIELVHYLGGKTVMYGICPKQMFGSAREETYEWTLELFTESAPLAEDRNIDIAVEFVNTCFPTTQTITEFLDRVGSQNVGVCLEVGNVKARPDKETLMEHLGSCGDRIKLVHLVDPANTDWLETIGVDLLKVVGALRNLRYDGDLVVEGFNRSVQCSEIDTEAARAAEHTRKLVKDASLPVL